MRVRFGVGLPGPFVLTSGRRRGGGGGFLLVLLGLFYLGAWFAWPIVTLVVTAVIVLIVVFAVLVRR